MTYDEALAYIASMQGRGWRLGLDRMRAFVEQLGLSNRLGDGRKPKFIHIAGTNGKGSVTAYVQAILTAAGFRTGGYFSPYVYDIRERIQMACRPIGKLELADLVSKMQPVADSFGASGFGEITEFEFKTALGFMFWAEQGCDWVALEVGLGGRLDATNVIVPAACVITSIGLDHVDILGSTEAEIAAEKAGIIKRSRPVVVGDVCGEALQVICDVASSLEAPLIHYPRDSSEPIAQYNAKLAALAVGAAGIDVEAGLREQAIAETKLPGRFQKHSFNGREFLLDGAHNIAAARSLAEGLRREYLGRRLVLLTGMLTGHEALDFYLPFEGLFSSAVVTSIDFHRARDPNELAMLVSTMIPNCEAITNRDRAIYSAIELAGNDGIVVVTGSFYLVGEVGRAIGADKGFVAS